MITFRVHFTDETTLDVEAETSAEARDKAKAARSSIIKKIKVVREQAEA